MFFFSFVQLLVYSKSKKNCDIYNRFNQQVNSNGAESFKVSIDLEYACWESNEIGPLCDSALDVPLKNDFVHIECVWIVCHSNFKSNGQRAQNRWLTWHLKQCCQHNRLVLLVYSDAISKVGRNVYILPYTYINLESKASLK